MRTYRVNKVIDYKNIYSVIFWGACYPAKSGDRSEPREKSHRDLRLRKRRGRPAGSVDVYLIGRNYFIFNFCEERSGRDCRANRAYEHTNISMQ
jgi:hypothetical protein